MPGAMDTSYLNTQVTTIIGQLHTIWDEIGIPRNDRESREAELFAALSETLHNQLRLGSSEKTKMTEEAQNIIETIKQMEASLDDEKDRMGYDLDTNGLRVTFPLNECLRDLKEKYNTVGRLHRERFEQVKKLVQALESYSSHLESSFIKIKLPPTNASTCPPNFDLSPSYVGKLDEEFTRVYDEYNRRLQVVQITAEEIVRLWSELGIPQAQTDSSIVQNYRDSPEQLGLHQSDLDRLKSRRDKLIDEKRNREKRLAEMKKSIEALWDRLGIEEPDRKAFLAANRGCGLRTINEYEDELARLNELKRQNLHLFVEDARVRLQELWDLLYFSEEEMLEFTPAFSDVYSDALLSAHEGEIERLNSLKDQRAPILEAIEKHKSLLVDKESLEASAQDASRLLLKPQKGEKRDPGKLLREEKMRKRIAKDLPKVQAALVKTLQKYEEDYGRPFLVHGQNYLDEIEELDARAPPPRSKTPNALPPRPKTPGAQTTTTTVPTKGPATSSRSAQPARPQSAGRNHTSSKSVTKTPTMTRSAGRAPPASAASTAASTQKSPSRIPARVPLGNLNNGNNSPERRHMPQSQSQTNFAATARTMGPPRAPPPKMRDLVPHLPAHETSSQSSYAPSQSSLQRANSQLSSNSQSSTDSSRYVRPMSPEDVYQDHERMSYMSTSLLNRNPQYQYQHSQAVHPPSHSQAQQEYFHASMTRSQMMPPPTIPTSRQPSNTSSNMTNGTTASTASENWETYSDTTDLEPEREAFSQQTYYPPSHANKRPGAAYAHIAPPPKMRPGLVGSRPMQEEKENSMERQLREGSDAWSTEEEVY